MKEKEKVVRPGGLELPTFFFVARRSIQLSYGRTAHKYYHRPTPGIQPLRKANFKIAGKGTARSRRLRSTKRGSFRSQDCQPPTAGYARNSCRALRNRARAALPALESSRFRTRQSPPP